MLENRFQGAILPLVSDDISRKQWQSLFLFCVFVLLLLQFLANFWLHATTYSMTIGGTYQVSDSQMYWTCANSLVNLQNFGGPGSLTHEFCLRRPASMVMLAVIAWLGNGNVVATLVIQAILLAAAFTYFAKAISSQAGILGITFSAYLFYVWGSTDVFATFMTESLGILLGLIGAAGMVLGIKNRSLALAAVGIAMVSLGLDVRGGAFFVLPLLMAWLAIFNRVFDRSRATCLAVGLGAIAFGFFVHALLLLLVNGSMANSHSAFYYTLYGLSVGGRGYQQVFVDHPTISQMTSDIELAVAVRELAISSVLNHPDLLWVGLKKGSSCLLSMDLMDLAGLPIFPNV